MRDTTFFHFSKLFLIQNYRFLYHGDQKISWWTSLQQSVRKLQNKMALLCREIVVRGRSCSLREESFLVESCSSETFFPPSYEHLGSAM